MEPARGAGSESNYPRAVVHKRILSVAESRPDASMESIASDVTGATTSLVEQVLEEYGDPGRTGDAEADVAEEPADSSAADRTGDSTAESDRDATLEDSDDVPLAMDDHDHTTAEDEPPVDPSTLTETQLETLREIYKRPDATQAALAETFDVSDATISQRVNGVDGFDWARRREFTVRLFESGAVSPEPEDAAATVSAPGPEADDRDPSAENDRTNDKFEVDRDDPSDPPTGGDPALDTPGEAPSATRRSDTRYRTDGASAAVAFEDATGDATAPTASETAETADSVSERLSELIDRVERLERACADDRSQSVLADPELAHKVVHACLASEQISETEELRILKGLLGPGRDGCPGDSPDR